MLLDQALASTPALRDLAMCVAAERWISLHNIPIHTRPKRFLTH